jgi:hypothetical protein
MNATELWGYIIGGIGLLVGIAGWLRNHRGDAASQAVWMGTVNAKLDHISIELAKLNGVGERMALIEASNKALHQRINDHLKFDHNKSVDDRRA